MHGEVKRLTEDGQREGPSMTLLTGHTTPGMPVNPVILTGDAWQQAGDPLVRQIQSGSFVVVLVPDDNGTGEGRPAAGRPDDE